MKIKKTFPFQFKNEILYLPTHKVFATLSTLSNIPLSNIPCGMTFKVTHFHSILWHSIAQVNNEIISIKSHLLFEFRIQSIR